MARAWLEQCSPSLRQPRSSTEQEWNGLDDRLQLAAQLTRLCSALPGHAHGRSWSALPATLQPASDGPRPAEQEQARTAVRTARLSVQLPGPRRPASPATCIPHGRTALKLRHGSGFGEVPRNTRRTRTREVDGLLLEKSAISAHSLLLVNCNTKNNPAF